MKGPLFIVLCEESPYDLIDVLDFFQFFFATMKFYKVGFTYNSSAGKIARNITKILQSVGF